MLVNRTVQAINRGSLTSLAFLVALLTNIIRIIKSSIFTSTLI